MNKHEFNRSSYGSTIHIVRFTQFILPFHHCIVQLFDLLGNENNMLAVDGNDGGDRARTDSTGTTAGAVIGTKTKKGCKVVQLKNKVLKYQYYIHCLGDSACSSTPCTRLTFHMPMQTKPQRKSTYL